MIGAITAIEKDEFRRLIPVTWVPECNVVRIGLPDSFGLCPRAARILAALLVEEASVGEAHNPDRIGDWMDEHERPAF